MKKSILLALGTIVVMAFTAGCTKEEVTTDKTTVETVETEVQEEEPLKIVTTIFPEYDWVREILGEQIDNVELKLLLDNGVDLHSYQATTDDMIAISESDLFIYVGGESDEWVDDVLENAVNKDMKVLNLMDVLGDSVKVEEMVEGMQEAEHDHDHEHEDAEEEHDEHVWLSLKNAKTICQAITNVLVEMDAANADVYKTNAETYVQSLDALDKEYKTMVENAKLDTILVGDRFPFRYLVDDYDIDYYAAFIGCSAETEASFETITFLSGKVDEENLSTVLTIEGSDEKIANTIIANTTTKDQKIATLDSIQSVSSSQVEEGVNYLSIMKDNLEVLKAALE